jgi:hypothetical protein
MSISQDAWREGAMAAGLVFLRWPPHWCGTVALRRPRNNTLFVIACVSAFILDNLIYLVLSIR